MRTKNFLKSLVAATIACCATGVFSSCSGFIDAVVGNVDNPAPTTQPTNDAAQLKQGIWTEYDEALLTSGKYTEEELAQMPTVGMELKGDKGYFFTYTAEDMSEKVEGQINYNKSTNTGTITFPYIAGNPLSIQTVNFSMTSDDVMQFEFTYEGKKVTGNCAWLCENLDNWGTESDDAEWKELMAYYESISAEGPDASASIDWSGSATVTVEDVDDEGNPVEKEVTVTDLDKPLEWNDEVSSARAGTRIAITSAITTGLKIFGSLFEEDPNEKINAKLDAILGKLDNVLQNQQIMMAKLDEINGRLIEIAQRMEKTEIVNMFNNRNEKFYNKLKVQNRKYFDSAYKLYKEDKNAPKLGQYAKAWVGKDEQFANLTWEYIEYLTTVEHTDYGKGMDRIYDGLVFDKYPWEHMGPGDRKSYRAYDLTMIAKCLFMISLYSTYGGLNDIDKEGLYNSYKDYKPKLKAFSEFKISDPDKFRVCQIKGAHFIMNKELQSYNYIGKNNDTPDPNVYRTKDVIYMPKWHEAGSIKIENIEELKTKLIRMKEMSAICNYYNPNNDVRMSWTKMMVDNNNNAGGAVYAKAPTCSEPLLLLYNHEDLTSNGAMVFEPDKFDNLEWWILSSMVTGKPQKLKSIGMLRPDHTWDQYSELTNQFYAAIVEKRY